MTSPTAEPAAGPPLAEPPPPRRRRRWLRRLALALALVVFGVAGGAYLLVRHYEGELTRIPLAQPTGAAAAALRHPKTAAQNFLLVGSDSRAGKNSSFGDENGGQRSDTVILAHLPADGARPTLVSFPRDAYVEVPAYRTARGTERAAHHDKLNAAFSLGGSALLVATIENLTGARIDHYVEVDFVGLERMVDAVGGVTLCARTSRNDPANGPNGGSDDFMQAGTHRNVSGSVALAFVRNRHSVPDGDLGRIQDQQYFLSQMTKKVLSVGTLTNPVKLTSFLHALTTSLTVDHGLSTTDMRMLVTRLRHTDPAHLRFITVPITTAGGRAVINGLRASVVLLDQPADEALFTQLFGQGSPGSSPSPTPSGTFDAMHPLRGTVLQVLNTTRRAGLAARVVTVAEAAGATATAASAPGSARRTSVVRYPLGSRDQALIVARLVSPSATLEQGGASQPLTLLVGSDFQAAVPAPVHASPSATPSATASASPRPDLALTGTQLSCGA